MRKERKQAIIDRYNAAKEDKRGKMDALYMRLKCTEAPRIEWENVLLGMLSYGLMDTDDARVSQLPKGVVENIGGGLPIWIYRDLEKMVRVQISTLSHIGQRIEYVYKGTQMMHSRPLEILFSLCTTEAQVVAAFGLAARIAENPRPLKDLQDLCMDGVYRVYTITVESSCSIQYKQLGVLLIGIDEKGQEFEYWIIDNNKLISLWLPVEQTYAKFQRTIHKKLKTADTAKDLIVNKFEEAEQKQREKIKNQSKDEAEFLGISQEG